MAGDHTKRRTGAIRNDQKFEPVERGLEADPNTPGFSDDVHKDAHAQELPRRTDSDEPEPPKFETADSVIDASNRLDQPGRMND